MRQGYPVACIRPTDFADRSFPEDPMALQAERYLLPRLAPQLPASGTTMGSCSGTTGSCTTPDKTMGSYSDTTMALKSLGVACCRS